MLVNLKRPPEAHHDPHRHGRLGIGLSVAVLVELAAIIAYGYASPAASTAAQTAPPAMGADNVEIVGRMLYADYPIPFEVASMLLLVAMIGAIVLSKREL
jgi:NADH-quinone oxidoreductase subunit J